MVKVAMTASAKPGEVVRADSAKGSSKNRNLPHFYLSLLGLMVLQNHYVPVHAVALLFGRAYEKVTISQCT